MTIEQVARLPDNSWAAADAKSGFLFDHLPKTGGSALHLAFQQVFGAENVSPHLNLGKTERWAEEKFSRYQMIVGHFHSPIPHMGISNRRFRLTILRDPVDRAISEYFYFRNDVHNAPWDTLVRCAKDHDLYAYVKMMEAKCDLTVSNRYAHHFAAQLSRRPRGEKELSSLANQAIDAYDLVGIHEDILDFLDLFCGRFGLPFVREIPRANVTSARMRLRDLDPRTRDRLIRLNRVDMEIYERVRSRFRDWKRAVFGAFARRDTIAKGEESPCELKVPEMLPEPEPEPEIKSQSFGDLAVEICSIQVHDGPGNGPVRSGETIFACLEIAAHVDVQELIVGIEISDDMGQVVFGTNTRLLGQKCSVLSGQRYRAKFAMRADLFHGRYFIDAALHEGETRADRCFHWCERLAYFDVVLDQSVPFVGYCRLETGFDWTEESVQNTTRF